MDNIKQIEEKITEVTLKLGKLKNTYRQTYETHDVVEPELMNEISKTDEELSALKDSLTLLLIDKKIDDLMNIALERYELKIRQFIGDTVYQNKIDSLDADELCIRDWFKRRWLNA